MKRRNFPVYIVLGIVSQLLLFHQDVATFAGQSSAGTVPSSSHSIPGRGSSSSGSSSSSSSSNNDSPPSSGQASSGGLSGSGAEESSPAELGGLSTNNNTGNQTLAVANAENTTSPNSD